MDLLNVYPASSCYTAMKLWRQIYCTKIAFHTIWR